MTYAKWIDEEKDAILLTMGVLGHFPSKEKQKILAIGKPGVGAKFDYRSSGQAIKRRHFLALILGNQRPRLSKDDTGGDLHESHESDHKSCQGYHDVQP